MIRATLTEALAVQRQLKDKVGGDSDPQVSAEPPTPKPGRAVQVEPGG